MQKDSPPSFDCVSNLSEEISGKFLRIELIKHLGSFRSRDEGGRRISVQLQRLVSGNEKSPNVHGYVTTSFKAQPIEGSYMQ